MRQCVGLNSSFLYCRRNVIRVCNLCDVLWRSVLRCMKVYIGDASLSTPCKGTRQAEFRNTPAMNLLS